MITAVILNWKRPEGVKQICRHLNNHDLIGEIIVWNNNAEIFVEPEAEKVKVINCSHDFGLFTRFAAASLAKHECILFHDDDILAPEETLKVLYEKWQKKPGVCHSPFGRNPKNGEYSMNSQFGPVEIMLTRYVLVHREVAVYALSKTPEFADLPGVPVGNGEDMILSYAAIDHSGKLNMAYRMETEDLYEEDEHAINTRFPGHIEHRTKIIQRCKDVFRQKKRLAVLNKANQLAESVKIVINRNR